MTEMEVTLMVRNRINGEFVMTDAQAAEMIRMFAFIAKQDGIIQASNEELARLEKKNV